MTTYSEIESLLKHLPGFEHGVGASAEQIRHAERQLGVAFPAEYREFLANLGWADSITAEIYGLGPDVPPWLDLVRVTLSERSEMVPRLPHSLLPIHNDGAGNHICIDTSSGSRRESAPIVFWSHAAGERQTPVKIADGFFDWLADTLEAKGN